jgi:hypothetical protein
VSIISAKPRRLAFTMLIRLFHRASPPAWLKSPVPASFYTRR